MSYYRPSFSQTVVMSRGGRGYSSPRGSSAYRGSSARGGSSWNDRGSGRGSFSSNRGGRFSSWGNSNNSSFDSRSRYSSSAAAERYSSTSRGRPDDSSYRRSSYRSEGPNSYSNRDASTRSPDRKRMRTEAPSSRRSHDGGYGGADGYGNAGRYESSQAGGGGGGYSDRRSSFADERRSTFRPPRDDYRKPVSTAPSATTRASPRGSGSYRGRVSSRGTRGGNRLSIRDGLVRRRVVDTASYLRKRGTTIRPSTTDYLRRLRISRIRSAVTRRTLKKSKSSEKEDSDKEVENWDDEVNEDEKKKDEVEGKEEEKKVSPAKKSPKKDKEKEKEESDKEDKKSVSEGEDRPRSKYTGRKFIRLTCQHCVMKCVTFREYSLHLYSGRHIAAMRKVAIKQKTVLARMRQAQRSAQRELEKNDGELAPRTIFCPLCKLNYRQLKSKHQMSEAHRNMKKFLMPYCRVCHITFKSPMLYENHMCSLEHIRRRASNEVVNGEKHGSEKDPESPVEEDLENFMTLDSVGDVDEEDEEGNKIVKSPVGEGDEANKPKEAINVGVEHVKKVEVYYCDLCHTYLPRHEDEERALKQHCRGRMHLQRYVRYKEDKDLRRQAERIHRKSQEAKEAKEKEKEKEQDKTDKPTTETKVEPEVKMETEAANEEDTVDDKMWADVDKDLGEILAEVNTEAGNKSSDEDEDSRPDGERYDRFRYSEKGGDEKEIKNGATEKENEGKEANGEEEEEEEKTVEKGTKDKSVDEK